jgi:hypothetical protein
MLVHAGMHPEFRMQPDDDPERGDLDRSAWGDLNVLQTGEVISNEAGCPHHGPGCDKAADHSLPIWLHEADSSKL